MMIFLDDSTADELAALALADGGNMRRLTAHLLARAIAAETQRRSRGTDAKVERLARELAEAVEKMP